jgi:hypothetical protein
LLQVSIQGPDGLDNVQSGLHRPLRIVFMSLWIAKVHQQPIAEILGNMALEALDDRSTGLLVRPHDIS